MNTDTNEKKLLTDKLESVHSLVIDWLKYADQKLAGLLVLNGGIIWGYTRFIATSESSASINEKFIIFGYSSIILSILFCILGMLPILSKLRLFNKNKTDSDNVLFFADIQKYNTHDYLKLLRLKLEVNDVICSKYDCDIAHQITANSKIATVKFRRIKFSSWLTISGSMTFIYATLSLII
jgi:hypothetical protein